MYVSHGVVQVPAGGKLKVKKFKVIFKIWNFGKCGIRKSRKGF